VEQARRAGFSAGIGLCRSATLSVMAIVLTGFEMPIRALPA